MRWRWREPWSGTRVVARWRCSVNRLNWHESQLRTRSLCSSTMSKQWQVGQGMSARRRIPRRPRRVQPRADAGSWLRKTFARLRRRIAARDRRLPWPRHCLWWSCPRTVLDPCRSGSGLPNYRWSAEPAGRLRLDRTPGQVLPKCKNNSRREWNRLARRSLCCCDGGCTSRRRNPS